MKSWVTLLLVILLLEVLTKANAATVALSFPSIEKVPGPRLISALYFDGYVWLNYAKLGIIRIDSKTMQLQKLDSYGDDLVSISDGGDNYYLSDTNRASGFINIYRIQDANHVTFVGRIPLDQEVQLLGIFDCENTICVITNQQLYVKRMDGFATLQIRSNANFSFGGYSFGASTSNGDIYVGFDRGEWGGGLYKINIPSGKVESIESDEKDSCDGLLKTACSPVTFVHRDPTDNKCVLAATGLAHLFMTMGGYFQVCGDILKPIFTRACDTKLGSKTVHEDNCYAIFSVALYEKAAWLATSDGLIKISSNGEISSIAYPKLTSFQGLPLSREIPGFWIMTTDANWGYSTSGYTPLIVSVPYRSN